MTHSGVRGEEKRREEKRREEKRREEKRREEKRREEKRREEKMNNGDSQPGVTGTGGEGGERCSSEATWPFS